MNSASLTYDLVQELKMRYPLAVHQASGPDLRYNAWQITFYLLASIFWKVISPSFRAITPGIPSILGLQLVWCCRVHSNFCSQGCLESYVLVRSRPQNPCITL